jgi:hypothetical protein
MSSNQNVIIILVLCCCIILPLIIYGSLWGTNTICDKTNPEDQPWVGMNCAAVYESSGGSPSPTPGPATNPCATYTNASLAKDVTQTCLQKVWKDSGCTQQGTAYPSDSYQGWWNASPGGLGTTVYCSGSQVSGNSAGNCGVGNYGAIVSDMAAWGSLTDTNHKMGCLGHT